MALTDIVKQLKNTFTGFNVVSASTLNNELMRFRQTYGEAEAIRIGEMDYIVINQVYRNQENEDVNQQISPLFYNSIHHDYAIIDAETSSTLIDEVYSRVTYMQRVCDTDADPAEADILNKLRKIIGDYNPLNLTVRKINNAQSEKKNVAKIFQCHLIKDTGVSAAPDVYSFMLKNGEIKEISDSVMKQIKRAGKVKLLSDRDSLEENRNAIQEAVYDKYMNSEIEIQNVKVKSIFEISLTFLSVQMFYSELLGDKNKKPAKDNLRNAVFNTVYIASNNNEFDSLNENIHICDSCGRDIIDVADESKIYKIHINTDAIDENCSSNKELIYATGCEDCLVQCEKCGGWHFNYQKLADSQAYSKVKLAPGRAFIKGLNIIGDTNYCSCRECIEWVYDEKSGTENEHDVMPMNNIAFINYAGEKIASYSEYEKFYAKEKGKKGFKSAIQEHLFAKETFAKFRRDISSRSNIDVEDIIVTSSDNCDKCRVCKGEFYRGAVDAGVARVNGVDTEFRCDVCREMDTEKVNMVTRIDGTVFLRNAVGKHRTVSKYIVTKLGTMKKISSVVLDDAKDSKIQDETEDYELLPTEEISDESTEAAVATTNEDI